MASRAVQLCFTSASPTYNDQIILSCQMAIMEGGSVFIQSLDVTVGLLDTIIQIQAAIASAVRARAIELGLSAISVNNVFLLPFTKA